MSNMSYCRFHNTLLDLEDCRDALVNQDEHRCDLIRYKKLREKYRTLDAIENPTEDQEIELETLSCDLEELYDTVSRYGLSKEELYKAQALIELCKEIQEGWEPDDLWQEPEYERF